MEKAVDLHVAIVPAATIDRINILNATKQGMLECIDGLKKADCVLIDAVKLQTTARTLSIIHVHMKNCVLKYGSRFSLKILRQYFPPLFLLHEYSSKPLQNF